MTLDTVHLVIGSLASLASLLFTIHKLGFNNVVSGLAIFLVIGVCTWHLKREFASGGNQRNSMPSPDAVDDTACTKPCPKFPDLGHPQRTTAGHIMLKWREEWSNGFANRWTDTIEKAWDEKWPPDVPQPKCQRRVAEEHLIDWPTDAASMCVDLADDEWAKTARGSHGRPWKLKSSSGAELGHGVSNW